MSPSAKATLGGYVLGAMFVLSLPLVTARIYAADELQYYAPLRSVWKDGDVSYANEYAWFLDRRPEAHRERKALLGERTTTGLAPNFAPIGCAILWTPWFAIGDVVARVGGWPTDGFSFPYEAAVCYGAAIYGGLGLFFLYGIALRVASPGSAFAATLVAWWSTAFPFYVYVTPPMAHATSLFVTTLFIRIWLVWREDPTTGRTLLLGLVGGLAVLTRVQNGLFWILPGLDLVATARIAPRRAIRQGALYTAVGGGVLLPQVWLWSQHFGQPGPPDSLLIFFRLWPRYLPEVLFSSDHGLLSWHPVWIPALAGWLFSGRARAVPVGPLLLLFVLNVTFLSFTSNWSGGMAFGQRRLLDCLYVVVLGGAMLGDRFSRRGFAVGALLLVWWNLSLGVQFGTGMIRRDGPVSWSEVARNSLVVVPRRALAITMGYVFDRDKYFESPREPGSVEQRNMLPSPPAQPQAQDPEA